MNLTEEKLESFVKRDMEDRNRELGWNAFRYRETVQVFDTFRKWWTISFDFQAEPGGEVKRIGYGGFPFTERRDVLKDYVKESYLEDISGKGIEDPFFSGFTGWIRERFA